MELRKFIKTAICEYLNEQASLENVKLNDNFRKWFGNSVTIENDIPIVFYHGTDINFKSFSKTKIGKRHWQSKSDAYGGGFFFTDKERYASHGGVIKKVYLKIKNPIIRTAGDYYYATDMYDNNSTTFLHQAKENGNDGIIIKTSNGSLYIVFNPNQIKSVDNDGTWDINDNNIYS
jgi:hypothetical protein